MVGLLQDGRNKGTLARMGYQTDFVGHLDVQPPLNEEETCLLNRISRCYYYTSGKNGSPRLVDEGDAAVLRVEDAAPQGWSNWSACAQGCCLSYDGGDKANHMIPWIKYLMSALLVPGATLGDEEGFEEFTCDHVLNGMVVGSRRDNGELFAITVRDNDVEIEMLWPGETSWSSYPPLRYQVEIDKHRVWPLELRTPSPESEFRR